MKVALQIADNGAARLVDASGKPLGRRDVDRPVFHVNPKLLVPLDMLGTKGRVVGNEGLQCEEVRLAVTSTLGVEVVPDGGIEIRQPYPNQRYFVGGSKLIRNGWIVPLPAGVTEFDMEFRWNIEGPALWRAFPADEWEVRHLMHIRLHPGTGVTYSMDSSCWPQRDAPAVYITPVTVLGFEKEDQINRARRQIVKDCALSFVEGERKGEVAGYFLEERVGIPGVPMEQAWSIDAFQDEQLHEVGQTASFPSARMNEAHRANALIEMPSDLFVRAVRLAEDLPFDKESLFGKEVAGIPGGLERHPALKLLCDWWSSVRPSGEILAPGLAMPLVRVRDDGEYWWGNSEVPNSKIEGFNEGGQNMARLGDVMLVEFSATQASATFDHRGMTIYYPNGEDALSIGIDKEDYLNGTYDEAWACLAALASFRSRFPAAWQALESA